MICRKNISMNLYQTIKSCARLRTNLNPARNSSNCIKPIYEQGQSPTKNTREYFYYIDKQGLLYLDDAKVKNFTTCFKDRKFLQNIFKRLKRNYKDNYNEYFPYISLCGREINYIRPEDKVVVYSHVVKKGDTELICYGNAGSTLCNDFVPSKLVMDVNNGRLYHPCDERMGSIGLIKTQLSIELARFLIFDNGEKLPPTGIIWNGKKHLLDSHEILQRELEEKETSL